MPKFFKRDILATTSEPLELESPLDTPELPPAHTPQRPITEPVEHQPTPNFIESSEESTQLVKDLLTWVAPARPYRKKDRSFFTNAVIISVLLILLALLFEDSLLIGAILSLLFLVFVLNFSPPEDIEYKISTQGITIGPHFYLWHDLDSYWIGEKDDQKILYIRTLFHFPAVLMLVLDQNSAEQVKQVCARYLPFHEIAPRTLMDDWSGWLQKHFPLENRSR